jgi:tRNA U34 5-methylaminomethyl-2-thiouridine-forming methyltransferase MnmC
MNRFLFTPKLTADGSFTFFSSQFSENFHSQSGAKEEAKKKFVASCLLEQKAKTSRSLKLLDICYGLGYNSAEALATIWTVNPNCRVELIGLELDWQVPRQAIEYQLLSQWEQPIPKLLARLAQKQQVETSRFEASLKIADARTSMQSLSTTNFQADAIFLDPFSPPRCPQLWTVEFIALLGQCLKPTGRLATYSCAASVRTALLLAGLEIGSSNSVGRRSPGTIASFIGQDLPPLSKQEKEHLQTRAAIPYRDPQLQDPAEIILERRAIEQKSSSLELTSAWKKRWLQAKQEHF